MKYKNPLFAPLAVGFFIGAITVGTFVLAKNHEASSRAGSIPTYRTYASSAPAPASAARTGALPGIADARSAPVPDPAVARVASRFTCDCADQCGQPVDTCTCPTAQGERAFIQDQLRQGRTEIDAAKAVNQKYGGQKS